MNNHPSHFKQYLTKRWQQIYTSPQCKLIWRGDVQKIKIKSIGSMFAILNQSLKTKRVVLDTKISTVYLNFEGKDFNFNKINKKEILFYLNFDNQQLVTNQEASKQKKYENNYQTQQSPQQIVNHPLIINVSPLCRNHSLFPMFPQQQLPQIISADIMLLLLNTFKLSPDLIIGYNSIGANSTVNHLHFHFLYKQDLIKQKMLPVEKFKRKIFHKTTLINPNQDINPYNVGVVLQQLVGSVRAIVLSPLDPKADQLCIHSSLSYVFGLFINELLQENIAHNILISQAGNKIYIFPRLIQNSKNPCGWIELSGVLIFQDPHTFEKCNEQIYNAIIKQIQIKESVFQSLKKRLINSLKKYI